MDSSFKFFKSSIVLQKNVGVSPNAANIKSRFIAAVLHFGLFFSQELLISFTVLVTTQAADNPFVADFRIGITHTTLPPSSCTRSASPGLRRLAITRPLWPPGF